MDDLGCSSHVLLHIVTIPTDLLGMFQPCVIPMAGCCRLATALSNETQALDARYILAGWSRPSALIGAV